MRKFAARSLFTITAMTTAIFAVPIPLRSQPSPTVEISRPTNQPVINSSSKKTSVVKMFEDMTIAPSAVPQAIELRGIS
ncbi:MAG: hypothetical protein ACK56L_14795, partial [Pseudanabaena sp.]